MLANVNSTNATQHNAAVSPANMPSPASSGMSFTDVLSSEISAAAPPAPTPPAPVTPPASTAQTQTAPTTPTSGASNQSGTGSDTSNTSGTSGTGTSPASGSVGKKGPKQTQTNTQADQAGQAAAATAAALASVANAQGKSGDSSTGSTAAANAAVPTAPAKVASSTATDPVNSLTGAVAANAAVAQVGEFNGKVPLSDAQGNLAGTNTAKVSNAIAAQTTIAVNPAATAGKNSAQQSSDFESALSKAGAQDNAQAGKLATTDTVASSSATSSNTGLNSASASSLLNADSTMQTIKSANQDLSAAQMSAIAPVLSAPADNTAEVEASSDTISAPVGTSAWDQSVGQKINWMVNENQQTASITLNPPELGPLQVVLSVNNQHASATFTSHQPEVRAALENAIPKLREMLGQSGIQLGDCNVNSQAKQQFAQGQTSSGSGGSSGSGAHSAAVASVNAISSISSPSQRSGIGLVDTFV